MVFLVWLLGAINGYLMVGTILSYYINDAQYPYPTVLGPPPAAIANSVQMSDDFHAAALAGRSLGLLRAHYLLDLYHCCIYLNLDTDTLT